MSTVNGQSVAVSGQRTADSGQRTADREEHVGGTHPYFFFPRGTRLVGLWLVGLWPVVRACGRDPPLFFIPA